MTAKHREAWLRLRKILTKVPRKRGRHKDGDKLIVYGPNGPVEIIRCSSGR